MSGTIPNTILPMPPIALVALVAALMEDEEVQEKIQEKERLELIALRSIQAKRAMDKEEDSLPKGKRTYIKYDQDRARFGS
jgi:hypothetical protein